MQVPTIDVDDAVAFLRTQGYACTRLDNGDLGAMLAFGFDAIRPSMLWLCIAGACFFAVKLLMLERISYSSAPSFARKRK